MKPTQILPLRHIDRLTQFRVDRQLSMEQLKLTMTIPVGWKTLKKALLGLPVSKHTYVLIVAWIILFSRHRIPDGWVIGGCIAAFLAQWLFDHQAPDVPARYPRLSTTIAAAACISLAVCLDQALKTGHV